MCSGWVCNLTFSRAHSDWASKRDVRESLVNEFLDEDLVWPKSRDHLPAPSGTYSNPSFSADPDQPPGPLPDLIQTPPLGTAALPTSGYQDARILP
ncbi:unnamed protein product [Boreogadus saida]